MSPRHVVCLLLLTLASPAGAQEKSKEEVGQLLSAAKPFYGSQVVVCAGQSAPGWAVVNVTTDFTKCGGNWDNLWTLFELNGASAGAQTTVCTFSANQAGWVAVGQSTDFTRCGRNASTGNLTTIRKL